MSLHDDAASALPSDADLLAAVRGGDDEAYGVLYERHAAAALRVAERMTRGTPLSAEDAVSQAFLNVLAAIRAGHGPGDSFRAYLYTVVRNEIMAARERESQVIAVEAPEDLETPSEAPDPAITAYESGVVGRAFSSLPERWQAVLWYHEVEGMKPGTIAPLLGLGANATSALLMRAREGLRQAYLSAHVEAADRPECRWSAERMGPHARGSLSRRDRRRFDAHLEDCADCRAMLAEVTEVARGLRAVVAPLVLGSGLAGWLARQAAAAPGPAGVAVANAAPVPRALLFAAGGAAASLAVALAIGGVLAATGEHPDPRGGERPIGTQPSDAPSAEPEDSEPAPSPAPSDEPASSDEAVPSEIVPPPRTDAPPRPGVPGDPPGSPPVVIPTPIESFPGDLVQSPILGGVTIIDASHSELALPVAVASAEITWVSDQELTRDIVVLDTPGGQFALAPDTVETLDMPDGSIRYVSTADALAMVQTIGAGTWTLADGFPVEDWQLRVTFEGEEVVGLQIDGPFELQAGESISLPLEKAGSGTARFVTLAGPAPTAVVAHGTLILVADEYVAIRRIVVLLDD